MPAQIVELSPGPNIPNVVDGMLINASENYLIRDLFGQLKTPNYGFRDRTGDLRVSIYNQFHLGLSDIRLEILSNVEYAEYVARSTGVFRNAVLETEHLFQRRIDNEIEKINTSS